MPGRLNKRTGGRWAMRVTFLAFALVERTVVAAPGWVLAGVGGEGTLEFPDGHIAFHGFDGC